MSLLNRPKSHESVIADVAALGVQRYCPECGKVHVPPKKPMTPQIKRVHAKIEGKSLQCPLPNGTTT